MIYTSYCPAPPLNAYIDDIYYYEGSPMYARLKALPMPSLHLMINFGQAFHWQDSNQLEPVTLCAESWCLGLWSRPYTVEWSPHVQFFGIHFKPGGMYPFLHLPLSELHNQVVPLDAIFGQYAAELRERLYDAPTLPAKFALFERMLLARLCPTLHGLEVVQYAIEQIARHHGAVSIQALSDHIGISQNHLGTLFKRMTGIPPKELARFYRLARVLRLLDPAQTVDLEHIAQQCRFYDVYHLIREFLQMTGHTPAAHFQMRRQVYAVNPEQARNLGNIPVD
jgi:AraC-like DNA-binding protein